MNALLPSPMPEATACNMSHLDTDVHQTLQFMRWAFALPSLLIKSCLAEVMCARLAAALHALVSNIAQANRQAGRQAGRQADRCMNRQMHKQTDRQTDRATNNEEI